MQQEHVLDAVVLLARGVDEESEASAAYNILLLEIMYYLFKNCVPADLFVGQVSIDRNASCVNCCQHQSCVCTCTCCRTHSPPAVLCVVLKTSNCTPLML